MAGSLAELMTQVVAVGNERRFARLVLADDPFFARMNEQTLADAIDYALGAGRAAADAMVRQHGRTPESIAAALGVPVSRSDATAESGKAVLFSEYADKPPAISIYDKSVAEANDLIAANDLGELLGLTDVAPVHLAHELYHHLEGAKLTPGTSGYRITTLKVGPLRVTSGLPTISEIAADRFARSVLDLKVPPKAIQFLTIYARNPDYAWAQLEKLRGLPER